MTGSAVNATGNDATGATDYGLIERLRNSKTDRRLMIDKPVKRPCEMLKVFPNQSEPIGYGVRVPPLNPPGEWGLEMFREEPPKTS